MVHRKFNIFIPQSKHEVDDTITTFFTHISNGVKVTERYGTIRACLYEDRHFDLSWLYFQTGMNPIEQMQIKSTTSHSTAAIVFLFDVLFGKGACLPIQ